MTKSHKNYEYFVTWIDDKSRKVFVDGIKLKSKVMDRLKTFMECTEVKMNNCNVALHSDGGGKYIAGTVQQYLKDKGIRHEMITPDMLQHNGVAEHMNRTLLDKVWAMLTNALLPEAYWYDTLWYTAHIHNITPTWALDSITLEDAWSRNKPDISDI